MNKNGQALYHIKFQLPAGYLAVRDKLVSPNAATPYKFALF